MILKHAWVMTTGIFGINIMRTCKKLHAESAPILYGENGFVFDTRGHYPFTHDRGVHEYDGLNDHRNLIPGLAHRDGTPQTPQETTNAIERMFKSRSIFIFFMCRDPFAIFLRAMGPFNESHLTNFELEGFFKTAKSNEWRRTWRPITFARILPIQSTILKHACPNVTRLSICQGQNDEVWEDYFEGKESRI